MAVRAGEPAAEMQGAAAFGMHSKVAVAEVEGLLDRIDQAPALLRTEDQPVCHNIEFRNAVRHAWIEGRDHSVMEYPEKTEAGEVVDCCFHRPFLYRIRKGDDHLCFSGYTEQLLEYALRSILLHRTPASLAGPFFLLGLGFWLGLRLCGLLLDPVSLRGLVTIRTN